MALPTYVTITDLPSGTTPSGTEPIETIQGGNSVFLTLSTIFAALAPGQIPTGGTTGQLLGKKSGTNYDTQWESADTVNGFLSAPKFVTSGASYSVLAADVRVLVNKTVGSVTSIVLPDSTTKTGPVLVKDLKGDAATNNITVTFTGGQTCDGLSSVVVGINYGSYWFTPLSTGGWYLS